MIFWGGLGMTAEAGPSLGLLLSSGRCCALSVLGPRSSSEGHFPKSLGPEISSWAHWPMCSHGRKDLVPVITRLAWSLFRREAVGGWSYLCIWIPGQTSPEEWEPTIFLGTLKTPSRLPVVYSSHKARQGELLVFKGRTSWRGNTVSFPK